MSAAPSGEHTLIRDAFHKSRPMAASSPQTHSKACLQGDSNQGAGCNLISQLTHYRCLWPLHLVASLSAHSAASDDIYICLQPWLSEFLVMLAQEDYDHSYFFMSTFMDDHIAHAAKYLL